MKKVEDRGKKEEKSKERMLFCLFLSLFFLLSSPFYLLTQAYAEVAIETSVSSAQVAIGEELTLDIIISNADGEIERPTISSVEGFSSYSQGHSQEISIINGRSSSRSIFSYVLIANSLGKKSIGPFDVVIGGKKFKIGAVEVEVVPDTGGYQGPSGGPVYSQGPVSAPPTRALPSAAVSNQDIFVKAWLDKDSVYVNEPATLTYTIYTRLTSTYKGFEKEPVVTGFWVEDFPPEKTIQRTEQIINGMRYVVADIRKMALFPTQAGIFTIEPGTIAATVEVRNREDFDSFFSYNIFGRRTPYPQTSFMSQVISRTIPTESQTLTVKALPEAGKPESFNGAVGDYKIESSIDKTEVEEGNPITYRVRVSGRGNINTVQTPGLPPIEHFKIYDSSSAANISKNRLIVEGEKVTETVLVPKKAGTYTIPALEFSYFDPSSRSYKQLKTKTLTLVVKPAPEGAMPPPSSQGVQPVQKEEVEVFSQDIRYIKTADTEKILPAKPLYRQPLYTSLNLGLLLLSLLLLIGTARKEDTQKDLKGVRFRRSHRVAKHKLKMAAKLLKKDKKDEFYAEISRALYGYFADKLNIPSQMVNHEAIEEHTPKDEKTAQAVSEMKNLFDELSLGRFAGR